jgi:hypothetical protein
MIPLAGLEYSSAQPSTQSWEICWTCRRSGERPPYRFTCTTFAGGNPLNQVADALL